ncbi:hypothetical protein WMW72_07400 [Paenibacillus filicis]|uniref:DUF2507 domain-containing protein n=1 Tax=Paenibacillus filicis TaxID=669464 RepID=A0ABU9DHK4_9BACL
MATEQIQAKLPQPYALWIEFARSKGADDELLLKALDKGDREFLESFNSVFKVEGLLEYAAEHPERVRRAISEGYEFTFLTVNGLKFLLEARFGFPREGAYEVKEGSLGPLQLKSDGIEWLQQRLPSFWSIRVQGTVADDSIVYLDRLNAEV